MSKYNHDKKKKLAGRIQKLKKKSDLVKIFEIIYAENQSIMENNNGIFMFFHKLSDETYKKIEKELRKINRIINTESADSETMSTERKEFKPYMLEEFPLQKGIGPKLKFSNKEKSIIKKDRYHKSINMDNESDVVYTTFNVSNIVNSDKNNSESRNSDKNSDKNDDKTLQ